MLSSALSSLTPTLAAQGASPAPATPASSAAPTDDGNSFAARLQQVRQQAEPAQQPTDARAPKTPVHGKNAGDKADKSEKADNADKSHKAEHDDEDDGSTNAAAAGNTPAASDDAANTPAPHGHGHAMNPAASAANTAAQASTQDPATATKTDPTAADRTMALGDAEGRAGRLAGGRNAAGSRATALQGDQGSAKNERADADVGMRFKAALSAANEHSDAAGLGAAGAHGAPDRAGNSSTDASTALPLPSPGAAASPTADIHAPATASQAPSFEGQLSAAFGTPEFAPALGVQLTVLAREGVQEARLHLNPAEMGPIAVQIAVDGTNAMVHFQADMAATRQALETSLPDLAAAMRDGGFTLSGGSVSQQSASGQGHGQGAPRNDATAARGVAGVAGAQDAHVASAAPARVLRRQGVVDLYA